MKRCESCGAELDRRTFIRICAPYTAIVVCRACRAKLVRKLPTTKLGQVAWWALIWGALVLGCAPVVVDATDASVVDAPSVPSVCTSADALELGGILEAEIERLGCSSVDTSCSLTSSPREGWVVCREKAAITTSCHELADVAAVCLR